MALKHRFTSAKADSTDTSLINPSNWNASHLIETPAALNGASGVLTGSDAAGELTLSGIKATAALQYLRQNSSNSTLEFASLPNAGYYISTAYNFALQSPPENLSSTLKVFTLSPIPF